MQVAHIKKQDLNTSKWSGGTTTQLFIYPPQANYAERNFLCRISTATVEVPESGFTPLPGIERILMILEGELTIVHKDRYTKKLQPFDTDTFSGDWETQGRGLVTDFNVMLKGGTKATLEAIVLNEGDTHQINTSAANKFSIIYLCKGSVNLYLDGQAIEVEKGDTLILDTGNTSFRIDLIGKDRSEVIICSVELPVF